MREILFRGKRIDNDEWVYGSFCMDAIEQKKGPCGLDGFIRLYDFDKGKMQMHEVDRDTVGQFTGETDKNGKKIFEGDILEAYYDDKFPDNATRTVVVWSDGLTDGEPVGWRMKQGDYEPDTLCIGDGKMNRVIGNIHDTPELLGGGNNA